ncbi:MAG: A/G-specific adenine glycosylase [Defluviitaleaceae bacterium]|nr:A/G-specific adenine glycosylase [Defluviitaleaceae bacterium]
MQAQLLQWYDENKRNLPWRATKNPYYIWVSEIMAQQTQINTLLPYYLEFIEAFPTIEALALAPIDQVLKICAGIGYYNRFHNMKKTAEIIIKDYFGQMPQDPQILQKLPGIGEYAAGAIASIAYNKKTPAMDGNVFRVMARLERNENDISKAATKKAIKKHLETIMPDCAGTFNQALMELGALICKPKNPLCHQCPVFDFCKGQDIRHQLPVKPSKKSVKEIDKTVFLLYHEDRILMRKRDEKLLHGLWEFYHIDKGMNEKEAAGHIQKLGYTCTQCMYLEKTSHLFTHLKWNMIGYTCQVEESFPIADYIFVPTETVRQLAIPSAFNSFVNRL